MTSVCWCPVKVLPWKSPRSILACCFGALVAGVRLCVSVLNTGCSVGFNNVVSIDMLRESYPLLDMVDHNRRPKLPVRYRDAEMTR